MHHEQHGPVTMAYASQRLDSSAAAVGGWRRRVGAQRGGGLHGTRTAQVYSARRLHGMPALVVQAKNEWPKRQSSITTINGSCPILWPEHCNKLITIVLITSTRILRAGTMARPCSPPTVLLLLLAALASALLGVANSQFVNSTAVDGKRCCANVFGLPPPPPATPPQRRRPPPLQKDLLPCAPSSRCAAGAEGRHFQLGCRHVLEQVDCRWVEPLRSAV